MMDWNGNGGRDSFDSQMDYHVSNDDFSAGSSGKSSGFTWTKLFYVAIGTAVVELLADIFLGIEQGGILSFVLGIPLGLLLYRLDEIVGKKEDKQS